MEKIADGYYRKGEIIHPSVNVTLDMQIDVIDGDDYDTNVNISGFFAVAGNTRKEFAEKLGELINEYRI